MTIWYLANQETFRQVSDRFGVRKSTAHYIVTTTVSAIVNKKDDIIKWPAQHLYDKVADKFRSRKDFPGVVGAIDGSYIPCKPPNDGRDHFINRKGNPSVVLQAVCDANCRFLDVYAERAGATHDARILRVSPFGRRLLMGNFLPVNFYLLGDSAYPCLPSLITPYRDNGHLTEHQRRFNYLHSVTRLPIEHAFGRLKGKFRRLKYVDKTRIDLVPNIVVACCILHNIIIDNESDVEETCNFQCNDAVPNPQVGNDFEENRDGAAKRNQIMEMLSQN